MSTRRSGWWLFAALAMLALLLRLPDIGNPLIDLDDQLYLLVGDRMRAGAIPYVDIWDRKPVGLFVIYWMARSLGGDKWQVYQLLALAVAAGTASLVGLLAQRAAGSASSLRVGIAAGAVYLVWIALLGGRGGQSPVFYNPMMAGAAWLTWRATTAEAHQRRWGIAAMLLAGLALQVKPAAVFEGVWFGIALLVAAWRTGERRAMPLYAGSLVAAALLPTLLAFGVYAAIGHADAWWFANVRSIFLRATTPGEHAAMRLGGITLVLLVPFTVAVVGLARAAQGRWLIAGWLIAAIAGLLAIPPYFNHYALPLVVPIAVLAGVAMAASRPLTWLVAAAGAGMLLFSGYPHLGETPRARRQVAAAVALVNRYRGAGCLFAFSAPPVLYEASDSCLPTRWPFETHLTLLAEAPAIGVNPRAEVARVLAVRPPVIVAGRAIGPFDPAVYAATAAVLARDYRPVGTALGATVYALKRRPADNP
ncbi:hypothetical protein [Sphingomonas oligophenolica]|nr:hypothetical protein [Sphingomonas oligophenolica]